jgi:hypothetical protein
LIFPVEDGVLNFARRICGNLRFWGKAAIVGECGDTFHFFNLQLTLVWLKC